MQIILLERIEKLGQMGAIVSVKDGFARNYLIPKGKALRATKRALEEFESRRVQLEANNLELRKEAEEAATQIDGRSVVILRQASESAHLYGSVSARDVAAAFTEEGVTIGRNQVVLDAPIKSLGIHDVRIRLHPEVDSTVQVNIARSAEEADIQAGKAAPVTDDDDEDGEVSEEADDENHMFDPQPE